MTWWDLILSRPVRTALTVGLAFAAAAKSQPKWQWMATFGLLIVLSEFVGWLRQRWSVDRLAKIQQRSLRVITDLALVSAYRYDLWILDLYVPKRSYETKFRSKLVRELSIAHASPPDRPPIIDKAGNIFAECFADAEVKLWWDTDLGEPSAQGIWDGGHSTRARQQLKGKYGALSVNPIVDPTGKRCRGVFVVHNRPDPEDVTTAVGALRTRDCQRRLREACHDIHELLGKA